jgi:hypothetical protein
VPDLKLAPELWSAELSRELEFGQEPAESVLERESELGLELEFERELEA